MALDHRDKAPEDGTTGGGEAKDAASDTPAPGPGLGDGLKGAGPRDTIPAVVNPADSGRAADGDRPSSVSRRTGTQATPRSRSASRWAMVASSSSVYNSDMDDAHQACSHDE